ncbi:MAG: TlpA disulfide reductase family protein [Paracoccaceae bacterium]
MKRPLLVALLYAALSLGANPGYAQDMPSDFRAHLMSIRTGDMRKMKIHAAPVALPDTPFQDIDGNEIRFTDSHGKFLVVNFWATWCAPCREEMPSLAALRTAYADGVFDVITIATGRNRIEGIEKFYAEVGITDLPILLDPKGKIAREMGVLGLPVTLIVDPEGYEIGRLTGGADWFGQDALTFLKAVLDGPDGMEK